MLQTTSSLIQHDPSGSCGAHNMLRAIHSLHASKAIAPSFWVFWAFRQMNRMCYLCYRVRYKSEANATRVACTVCCINLRRGWGVHFQSTGPSWWLRLGAPQGGILTSWSFFFLDWSLKSQVRHWGRWAHGESIFHATLVQSWRLRIDARWRGVHPSDSIV